MAVLPHQPHLARPACCRSLRQFSTPGHSIVVDFTRSQESCTCPDFMTRRQSLPVGHINRCCKHVFDAYRQVVSPEDCQGWLRPFIENGWPPHPNREWTVAPVAGAYVLASNAPSGWSNVYAANGDGHGRYGYNLAEDRWAYGDEPSHAESIVNVIHQICLPPA